MASDDVFPHVDSTLAAKVKKRAGKMAGAFFVLFMLCCGSFTLAVVTFELHNREGPDELAQCIVNGIAMPLLVISSRLVADIEPNKGGLTRFEIATFVDACFTFASVVLAIISGIQAFGGAAPESGNTLRFNSTFLNVLNVIWGIVVGVVSGPMRTLLHQCVRAPDDAATEANDQRPETPAALATA
ncbi:hypothetical protein ACJZ2D_000197 [Fusarium nematophilum]